MRSASRKRERESEWKRAVQMKRKAGEVAWNCQPSTQTLEWLQGLTPQEGMHSFLLMSDVPFPFSHNLFTHSFVIFLSIRLVPWPSHRTLFQCMSGKELIYRYRHCVGKTSERSFSPFCNSISSDIASVCVPLLSLSLPLSYSTRLFCSTAFIPFQVHCIHLRIYMYESSIQ